MKYTLSELRSLDEKVAEATGWITVNSDWGIAPIDHPSYRPDGYYSLIPHYTTEISEAWLLVEKLKSEGYHVYLGMLPDEATASYSRQGEEGPEMELITSSEMGVTISVLFLRSRGVSVDMPDVDDGVLICSMCKSKLTIKANVSIPIELMCDECYKKVNAPYPDDDDQDMGPSLTTEQMERYEQSAMDSDLWPWC
jgi:hypothetical protein